MTTHELKTWPTYFQAIQDGTKTFEVRRNDRDFQSGDILHLKEWNPVTGTYTGREDGVEVSYVLPGGPDAFGVAEGHVVLGIKPPGRLVASLRLDDGIIMWDTRPEVTDSASTIKELKASLRDMAAALDAGWKRGRAKMKASA